MDSILSVRINEDLKNKFLKLAEDEGVNNKEFMDLVIKSYEMNRAANAADYVKNDVEELQSIIKRVMDIYINVVEKNKVRTIESNNNFKEVLLKEEEKVNKAKEFEIALKEEVETLKMSNSQMEKKLVEIQKDLLKEKEITREYKEHNEMLKLKLKELEGYKETAETLIRERDGLELSITNLSNSIEKYIADIERYGNQIKKLETQLSNEERLSEIRIQDIKEELERKSALKEEELTLKLKQEVFQKEEAHRNELWEVRNSYESRITKLLSDKELLLEKLDNFDNNKINKKDMNK